MIQEEDALQERLNAILPRLRSEDFLASKGLGNEIAFYVFDYPARFEIKVRQHIAFVADKLKRD